MSHSSFEDREYKQLFQDDEEKYEKKVSILPQISLWTSFLENNANL
jgi:hypothetical protein